MLRLFAVFAASFLLPAGLLAQEPEPEDPPPEELSLHGGVVDHESGEPLPGASLTLRSSLIEEDRIRVTDADGRFSFGTAPDGDYELHVQLIGYGDLVHEVAVEEHWDVDLRIELTREAIPLEPVVVEVRRMDYLARRGFYERQERGFGRFITRPDIERNRPSRVTDLLRMVPSVRVGPGSFASGGIVTMRRGCVPTVYLDGAQMAQPVAIDDVLAVEDVEAIEVYRGAETPVQFMSPRSGCGSLVLWTRPGGRSGQPFSWRRLLAAGAFVVGAILATQ